MPSINDNVALWDGSYDWSREGEEWSALWGDVDMQWYCTILPRVHRYLPARTILEIAPGFGRWSKYLLDHCEELILVDLSPKCIDACRKKFGSFDNVTYHVNDGRSLDMIDNDSVDFVFSFDSLVHAEADIIEQYLNEIKAKLRPDGIAFIHHSNLHEYWKYYKLCKMLGPARWRLAKLGIIESLETGWRAPTMSSSRFRSFLENADMHCVTQEMFTWQTRRLIDCITVFCRKGSKWELPTRILRNRRFFMEAQSSCLLSRLYGRPAAPAQNLSGTGPLSI